VWLTRLEASEKWTRLALSLILAGAVGNLIDRALHGYVIDFIDFFYPATHGCLPLFVAAGESCHWPTFNIADSAISVGAVLLLISQFFEARQTQ
jgi:signal peptidase II